VFFIVAKFPFYRYNIKQKSKIRRGEKKMPKHHFFAMLSRMKYINRWGLMRNTKSENVSEHSHAVAVLAHALAVIKNKHFGGRVNAERAVLLSIFHDSAEIFTGDLPTPVKYYNEEINKSYKQIEEISAEKLVDMLPENLREDYAPLLIQKNEDAELQKIIKAADRIAALIKCVEEEKAGNSEFKRAKSATLKKLKSMGLPEVDFFLDTFLPSFSLTLDEQE